MVGLIAPSKETILIRPEAHKVIGRADPALGLDHHALAGAVIVEQPGAVKALPGIDVAVIVDVGLDQPGEHGGAVGKVRVGHGALASALVEEIQFAVRVEGGVIGSEQDEGVQLAEGVACGKTIRVLRGRNDLIGGLADQANDGECLIRMVCLLG